MSLLSHWISWIPLLKINPFQMILILFFNLRIKNKFLVQLFAAWLHLKNNFIKEKILKNQLIFIFWQKCLSMINRVILIKPSWFSFWKILSLLWVLLWVDKSLNNLNFWLSNGYYNKLKMKNWRKLFFLV